MYGLILGDWVGQSGRRLNGALQIGVESAHSNVKPRTIAARKNIYRGLWFYTNNNKLCRQHNPYPDLPTIEIHSIQSRSQSGLVSGAGCVISHLFFGVKYAPALL